MRLFGWFRRTPPTPTPTPTPEDRFRAAVDEFNEAWKEYETHTHWQDRIRPWTDWNERRIDLTRIKQVRVD